MECRATLRLWRCETELRRCPRRLAIYRNQIQNFIASKVDGILVATLVDPTAGHAISKAAQEAGIPLVFVNNAPMNVDSLPDGQAFVGSDDLEAGTLQAEAVCKLLGGKAKRC